MTPPRQVLPDRTVELTRRTVGRTFRFLPHREIKDCFLYVLGHYAEKHNMTLHGLVLMVTHYHLMAHDNDGNMPDFMRDLNGIFARAINARQGESDTVLSGKGYCDVEPQSGDDLIGKLVYGMANPAAADLVHRVDDFPGLVITPDMIGVDITVARPKFFFSEKGKMPKTVTLRFEIPKGYRHMGLRRYRKMLWTKLRQKEREHRQRREQENRTVLGVRRLRQAGLGQRSRSWEAWFTLRPSVAAKDKNDRVRALERLKAFHNAYREAYQRWRDGDREVMFPIGTWWLPRFAGARCFAL